MTTLSPSESAEPFTEYTLLLERQAAIAGALEGSELVDDNVQAAYESGLAVVNGRLSELRADPERLVEGAVAVGETVELASSQLGVLRDVLPAEELGERMAVYRPLLGRAAGFLLGQFGERDDRVARILRTAESIGGITLTETLVTQEATVPPPASESENADSEITQELSDRDARLAAAIKLIQSLGEGEIVEIRPGEFWQQLTGEKFTTNRRSDLVAVMKGLSGYATTAGEPVIQSNGKVGKATRYMLRGGVPVRLASDEAKATLDDNSITVQDALTLATFFKLYEKILDHKRLPTLSSEVLDAILDLEAPNTGLQKAEDIRASRAASFRKMRQLTENPATAQASLEGLDTSDPRRTLIEYLALLDGSIAEVESFLNTYIGLQVAVTVDKKVGGVAVEAAKEIRDSDGLTVGESPAAKHDNAKYLQTLAAQEQFEQVRDEPSRDLYACAQVLAARARTHNVLLNRPYKVERLRGIFPELALTSADGASSGTMTVAEVITTVISSTRQELLASVGSPEDSLKAIFAGAEAAYVTKPAGF